MDIYKKEHEKERKEELERGVIKIILLGECGVGKTSLIKAYLNKKFDKKEITTSIPVIRDMNIESSEYKSFIISFWDTAGQERYRSLTSTFYKGSHIVIFVYAINNKESFKQLEEYWFKSITDKIGEDVIFGLIGNKSDLYFNEEVGIEEGAEYSKKIKAQFTLASAKDNRNGIILFINELIEKFLKKENLFQKEEKINLETKKKPKKKCCF